MTQQARPGVLLGAFDGQWVYDTSDTHLGLWGPTGSGKDVSAVLPVCVTWPGSLIVFDPKDGETMAATSRWRAEALHSEIIGFNPECRGGPRIDVTRAVRLKTPHEFQDALMLAEGHCAPAKQAGPTQTSMHFHEMATTFLAGAILHTLYDGRRPSMPGVLDFLTIQHKDLKAALDAMIKNTHLGEFSHSTIVSLGREIAQVQDRELSGIWTTTMRGLHLYRDVVIAENVEHPTVDLSTLQQGPNPTTLYLIAPSPHALNLTHPLYRVIYETVVSSIMRQSLRTPRIPMLILWNEFPSYGYVPTAADDLATIRQYGVKLYLISQDLDQFNNTYGPHSAIWGNLHIKMFHTPGHDLTAKRISENVLGDRTMERELRRYNHPGIFRKITSVEQQRYNEQLMQTADVMNLNPEWLIMKVDGMPPALLTKLRYHDHASLRSRVDAVSRDDRIAQ